MKTETCRNRWADAKRSRFADLRKLWTAYCEGEEETDEGSIYEYGLAFDYVAPDTFGHQPEGYWRYQISYGGPSEEIRFYSSSAHSTPYRITFVFLDWSDGHERKLVGKDNELAAELWNWFDEGGSTESEFTNSMN